MCDRSKYMNQIKIDLNYLKSMEFINDECSSSHGEETSELSSEYDSSIYTDNEDIEFLSASEDNDEKYFAPNAQKVKDVVNDDDIITGKDRGMKRPLSHSLKTKSNKNCKTMETTEHTINIPCKNLVKGPTADTWTYNIALPKNTGNFVINLKRRKLKTISLNCTFDESVSLVHQANDVIITSNTQQAEQSKLSFYIFSIF